MQIRPLGHRILVRPDAPPQESDIIHIPDVAKSTVEMSGEVIALGDGPESAAKLKRQFMADIRAIIAECADTFQARGSAFLNLLNDEIGKYGTEYPHEYDVKVGDRLVFPWNVGVKVSWDGEDLILLNEDDPVAVIEDEEASEAA